MVKWIKKVEAPDYLDPLEAQPVDMAILLIKGAIESAFKAFVKGNDGGTVVYRNGLNGTCYDCVENHHLPLFAIYEFGYFDPIAMVCYIRNPKTGTTSLKVYHRKDIDEKFKEFTVDAFPYTMSEDEWHQLKWAFFNAFDSKRKYDSIWAKYEEEVDAI